jgi:hypothetical protein
MNLAAGKMSDLMNVAAYSTGALFVEELNEIGIDSKNAGFCILSVT